MQALHHFYWLDSCFPLHAALRELGILTNVFLFLLGGVAGFEAGALQGGEGVQRSGPLMPAWAQSAVAFFSGMSTP